MKLPSPPKLLAYKDGKRAWTTRWIDDSGKRQSKRFGMEGEVGKREATARFDNWMQLEWGKEQVQNPTSNVATFTVRQLADQFEAHALTIYVKHGRPTSHNLQIHYAMAALRNEYGYLVASDLDNPKLADLVEKMIHNGDRVLSLKTVNGRLFCIKQAYTWARGKGLVSATCLQDILAVPSLRIGRSSAKNPKKIKPVEASVVEKTLQKCPPTLQRAIRTQWLTGARPGEILAMRKCDIETQDGVWLYRPSEHKTEHFGGERVIPIGPKAQDVLAPLLLKSEPTAYLFSPAQVQRERRAARHEERKTPEGYGNGPRPESEHSAHYREKYDKDSFRKAIHYACDLAEVERWNPHQLRHSRATELNKRFGIQGASVVLGHTNLDTTQIYAEKNLEEAKEIARLVG